MSLGPGWTGYQWFLALMMLITGSINTLTTKFADLQKAPGKPGTPVHDFNHPFLQASGMFIGEFSCLVVFKIWVWYHRCKKQPVDVGNQNFNPLVFLAPALCDMTGTSLMYIGLNLTYASSFQMLRGAVIIFTGLLSVAFLGRKLKMHHWVGIFFVLIGLILVGVSDFIFKSPDSNGLGSNGVITGDLLILMAQVIAAIQMVVEEKFVSGLNIPPMQGVGWEGLFGFTVLTTLLFPFYFMKVGPPFGANPRGVFEDALDGLWQISNNVNIALGVFGTIISIAFFNFAGLSVTKEMSATTRMVLDSVRTLVIWVFSLAVGWEDFQYLQLIGFLILLSGTAVYNDMLFVPLLRRFGIIGSVPLASPDERKPLIQDDA
ncbi:PREDICTED: solute carrier family 35 member F6-like [Branchiostoma belcheri]|uniref:Solute carrier family 35 member F6-like n=1 Tax=Branchiostoma belcheri TaxID=7741 RepID=A0A6P5A326_BRABE|nr:PREDICTED: solute carrier family 35 member F6-like [Branchiostoma belcheri]